MNEATAKRRRAGHCVEFGRERKNVLDIRVVKTEVGIKWMQYTEYEHPNRTNAQGGATPINVFLWVPEDPSPVARYDVACVGHAIAAKFATNTLLLYALVAVIQREGSKPPPCMFLCFHTYNTITMPV